MKLKILVVDEDAENCRALSELLAVEGFDPLVFESAEAARSAMAGKKIRPAIVVANVRMPGLGGVALLQRIKAQFPAIPVILVSVSIGLPGRAGVVRRSTVGCGRCVSQADPWRLTRAYTAGDGERKPNAWAPDWREPRPPASRGSQQ
jgi:CheY-like chemotaxis protein